VTADVDTTAAAFDSRNGNAFISGLVADYRARAAQPVN
jgi:hypothetical protein